MLVRACSPLPRPSPPPRPLSLLSRLILRLWGWRITGRYPFEEVHLRLGAFFRSEGIDEIDLLPALRGQAASGLWVHGVDHHPNQEAHGRAAEVLAPVVARLLRDGGGAPGTPIRARAN